MAKQKRYSAPTEAPEGRCGQVGDMRVARRAWLTNRRYADACGQGRAGPRRARGHDPIYRNPTAHVIHRRARLLGGLGCRPLLNETLPKKTHPRPWGVNPHGN